MVQLISIQILKLRWGFSYYSDIIVKSYFMILKRFSVYITKNDSSVISKPMIFTDIIKTDCPAKS